MGAPVRGERMVRVGMRSAYWLWVTNGRGLADSVRAVGIDESAEPWARAAAERLARELGVLVEPSSPPAPTRRKAAPGARDRDSV
jgi:hypothetical protein